MTKRRDIESPIQAAIYQYLFVAIPKDVGFPFAIMNGLDLSPAQRRKAVWMGLKPGMSDLGLVLFEGRTLWFEVKTPEKGSKQSDEQIKMEETLTKLGHRYYVVRSIDDVREILGYLGIPTRETTT